MERKVHIMMDVLKQLYPHPKIALHFSNTIELIVAVVLSAQCTDKKVNEVTEKLFKKYTSVHDFANARQEELEKDVKSTGFYRNKAKNIRLLCKKLIDEYDGELPRTMDAMLTLPGVARKTANVVLGEAFGIQEGIAIDTHMKRLSQKFGLTNHTNPDKIEQDLMKLIPKSEWRDFTRRLVQYGRDYSPARKKHDTDDPISKALRAENLL